MLHKSNPSKTIFPYQPRPRDKRLWATRGGKVSWSEHYYGFLYKQPIDLHIAVNEQWLALAQDLFDSRALGTLDDKSQRLSTYILRAR
jgi:hypothetical protein